MKTLLQQYLNVAHPHEDMIWKQICGNHMLLQHGDGGNV
jgi:hypothetical protein